MPVMESAGEVDAVLAHSIEETILFGKAHDGDALLTQIGDELRLPAELRRDLESLLYFRQHYGSLPKLSSEARQQVIRYDADWTMQIIQRLHVRTFGTVTQASHVA